MPGAKIKPLNLRTSHMSNVEIADRQELQDNLKNNYEPIDTTTPEELHGYARKEWQKIVPLLKKQTPASQLDRSQLINYCLLAQTVNTCQKYILKDGLCVMTDKGTKRVNLTSICKTRRLRICELLLAILVSILLAEPSWKTKK